MNEWQGLAETETGTTFQFAFDSFPTFDRSNTRNNCLGIILRRYNNGSLETEVAAGR